MTAPVTAAVPAAAREQTPWRRFLGDFFASKLATLGLVMLEQGWITQAQLRRALDAQKAAGTGRLGDWLIQQDAVAEDRITRALGLPQL